MAQLAARMQAGGLLLVDVRSAAEFARGCVAPSILACFAARRDAAPCARRVPGAVNVPLEELSARARGGELGPATAPLAVVCASGARSAQACVRLKRVLGFADVSNARGGLAAWEAAGLPMQRE